MSTSNESLAPKGLAQAGHRKRSTPRWLALLTCVASPTMWLHSLEEREQTPAFRVETDVLLLNVSVTDSGGSPVTSLEERDFEILEDGEPQPIVYFHREFGDQPTPSSILLLIDASSSMEGSPLEEARRAAGQFIETVRQPIEISILAFDEETRSVSDFSSSRPALREALERLAAGGGTALYDAVKTAIAELEAVSHQRRILVILSDGQDLDSHGTFGEMRALVERSSVTIYSIGHYSPSQRELFMMGDQYYKEPEFEVNLNPVWILREIAGLSGGRAFFPNRVEELAPLFSEVARELSYQYVLAYVPPPSGGEPTFHSIEVRVQGHAQSGPLRVRTRRGYYR